jgi:hypothetical protein
MLRSRKDVDWSRYLEPDDMPFLKEKIDKSEWYPFDAFERMGVGILQEIAGGDMNLSRLWGRSQIDDLFRFHDSLVSDGDPGESLVRFQVVRSSFFDFDPVKVLVFFPNYAKLEINYGMCEIAEEAATWQTLGFFERLLALSGATNVQHDFTQKKWEGAPATIMEMEWSRIRPEMRINGAFFVDYVRMMKKRKEVDWSPYLEDGDKVYLEQEIKGDEWYPLDVFERMCIGIFREVARAEVKTVRTWGRSTVDHLVSINNDLVSKTDPRETLMRFHVLRKSMFTFDPVDVQTVSENYARFKIIYNLSRLVEKLSSYQTLGYIERLLELSGADFIRHKFTSRAWEGDPITILEVTWSEAVTGNHVKGSLFVDYVRMIKARKDVDWSKHLNPVDMGYLDEPIVDGDWYPMESFERMGVGILKEIAGSKMELVRGWGRGQIDDLLKLYPSLVSEDDPRESLMRFQVLRGGFFDFNAVYIRSLLEKHAKIEVNYEMGKLAEKAATYQAVGFFERLLELSGAKKVKFKFAGKLWSGDPTTILVLDWD